MPMPSLTFLVSGAFVAYIAHSIWVIYTMFQPTGCPEVGVNCLTPFIARNRPLTLWVYANRKRSDTNDAIENGQLLGRFSELVLNDESTILVNCSIPLRTRKNGTLFAHIFLTDATFENDSTSKPHDWLLNSATTLTTWAVPQAAAFQLVGEKTVAADMEEQQSKPTSDSRPISHLRSQLTISLMTDEVLFDRLNIPHELHPFLFLAQGSATEYLPLLYVDEFSSRTKDLVPINLTSTHLPLTLRYRPISYGKLRLWTNLRESLKVLEGLGFTEKDVDEVKGLFVDTSLYLLLLTFLIAAFHLLFDFLAFKNDISYWRQRKTMAGLSSRTVVWRCVSTLIIFLYLMDEQTSLLVLIPAGIGAIIEAMVIVMFVLLIKVWKVLRAFKVRIGWSGRRPTLAFGGTSNQEKETADLDSQAMKYLSFVLYPLLFGGAIYSLLYTPHKSWYSWCVQSLVNGVYAFGFIFMLPQLFINYKLKSVAHLPWRAFMYKAFNTFIDDVFAFIITMPTAHRLACFRDDIIFVIYLYQRWLYPVDKTRVNEFGQSFEDGSAIAKTDQSQQKSYTNSANQKKNNSPTANKKED